MADEERSEQRPPEGGIFGKLPDSRPGTRSPRRRSGAERAKASAAKASKQPAAKAKAASKPKPKPEAAKRPSPVSLKPETAAKVEPSRPPREAAAEPEGGRGLEDLAWAGVAVAAEAATVGVRIASKAIEALRGSQERR